MHNITLSALLIMSRHLHSYKYDFRTSFNFFKLFNDFIQDNIFFFFLTIFFIYKSCILSNTCYLYRYILVPLHFTAVWKGKTGVMNIHNLFVVSLLILNVQPACTSKIDVLYWTKISHFIHSYKKKSTSNI
jgi:hypothetical protein